MCAGGRQGCHTGDAGANVKPGTLPGGGVAVCGRRVGQDGAEERSGCGMKTEEIVRSLRWCGTGTEEGCNDCAFEPQCDEDAVGCVGDLCDTAADKIEELVARCARYAEEIAVLREEVKS